jgi:hypothetical protein
MLVHEIETKYPDLFAYGKEHLFSLQTSSVPKLNFSIALLYSQQSLLAKEDLWPLQEAEPEARDCPLESAEAMALR